MSYLKIRRAYDDEPQDITWRELEAGIIKGEIGPHALIWNEIATQGEWRTLDEFELFHNNSPVPYPPGPRLARVRERETAAWCEEERREAQAKRYSQRYFLDTRLDADESSHLSRVAQYSSFLAEVEETPLWKAAKDEHAELFRFSYIRSFDAPICVRVQFDRDGSGHLVVKMLNKEGSYWSAQMFRTATRDLPQQEIDEFRRELANADFWTLPVWERVLGLDGAEWIIEGATPDEYHVVTRWSPQDGPVRAIGLMMLKFSGLAVDPIY